MCYEWLKASDWKLLPEQGGLLDQNATLMADMFTYMDYDSEFEAHNAANQAGV